MGATAIKTPEGFESVTISEYLKGRRYSTLHVKAVINAVKPLVDAHNALATSILDIAVFEISMSAKYQTLDGRVRGLKLSEVLLFADYDDSENSDDTSLDDGGQDRFEDLACEISAVLEDLFERAMDYEIKAYGIMFDIE
jgi:hypothetical protein